ncbi:acetyl-CoA carboxylase biotin carboxyl carrier protein subunit [Hungatella effluvii]|uniref:acetyl-CoA carboxylase biotin carboxyl carrier protein subunit n=1 Tax=Hungatella effluvii TaxID=1096246 RepID=UPI0022E7798E|nr:acetyl-CoA carboxylase biotin carboxyl carrier protein subunit [Hungatella effluvii]
MGIKVFRIVLDGVVHEVEVEEIHREAQGGGYAAPAGAVPQKQSAGGTRAAAEQKRSDASAGGEVITAPLQGIVLAIPAASGQTVKCGDVLVIIEAMKMENEIIAPRDCTVTSIITSKGAAVAAGDPLLEIS